MKLMSLIMAPVLALAIATPPALADEPPVITITINGKTYTMNGHEESATTPAQKGESCKGKCVKPGSANGVWRCGPCSFGGTIKTCGSFNMEDFDKRMKELENDPDAKVVKSDDGNVKSVSVTKSSRSGKFFKDGKLVKSWGDEGPDEDVQKMIDEMRTQCRAAEKSAVPASKRAAKAKATGRKASPDEIKAIRQQLEELKKQLDDMESAK